MKRNSMLLILAGTLLSLGLLTMAGGQDAESDDTVENRLRQLERMVATLDTQLQLRTATGGGPEDRTTRDFNLTTRLSDIERRIQQLGNDLSNLQRQTNDAVRVASQAQRDAQLAQQIARDAANRIR